MTKLTKKIPTDHSMRLLSRLLLTPRDGIGSSNPMLEELSSELRNITREEFANLLTLANSNHVVVRGLEVFLDIMREAKDDIRAEWALDGLAAERARIAAALTHLEQICTSLDDEQYGAVVIKSLDHWPDLGSDLDLYTDSNAGDIISFMRKRFHAQVAPRSWGDQLAGKRNFLIPGLSEAVEIHIGRLGQTGEQVAIASRLVEHSRRVVVGDRTFRVPSASDRLMISTLQRMYRHFYFRLCDIVDTAALSKTGDIDYGDLRASATDAGIWEGVATYLVIVSDYVRKYAGSGLNLPDFVVAEARFRGNQIFYAKEFLRVPIMPQSARLYGSQLACMLRRRELQSGARLCLLPWLATAALVGQTMTGSDKGIW